MRATKRSAAETAEASELVDVRREEARSNDLVLFIVRRCYGMAANRLG